MKTQCILARTAASLLFAMAGVHAHAGQASQAAAADPQAAVPATRYQPTLQSRPEAGADTSPDRNWVASNQKVAATNSMALTMKTGMAGMDMGKQGDKMACCASCPCMNKSKDAGKPAPDADPHAHHHQETQ
jgi:hypothetical protein